MSDAPNHTQNEPQAACPSLPPALWHTLKQHLKTQAQALGFADVGITDVDLSDYEPHFFHWLAQGHHGTMDYMHRHGTKRTRPTALLPLTKRVISVRMHYYDLEAQDPIAVLQHPHRGYVSRYALNKDYHKLMRKRLKQLGQSLETRFWQLHQAHTRTDSTAQTTSFQVQGRPFCDSAPVLERPLAHKAGLGFIGKNSLIIHPRGGSWFFLGELYTNLPLPTDPVTPMKQGCGPCRACLSECPTQAIVGNAVVDARRCVSYLTIEYSGVIPEPLRAQIGNRIYGCDDCQLVCPWNRFAKGTQETAFQTQHDPAHKQLDQVALLEMWHWSAHTFDQAMAGSPIRRIGYDQWRRNLSIALGNALIDIETSQTILKALKATQQTLTSADACLDEHLQWAIARHQKVIHGTLTPIPFYRARLQPAQTRRYVLPPRIPKRARFHPDWHPTDQTTKQTTDLTTDFTIDQK